MVGWQPLWVDLCHCVHVAADMIDREASAPVTEVSGEVTILPEHEDSSLAGFFGLSGPGDAGRRQIGWTCAHKCDVGAFAHRQQHLGVRVLLRPSSPLGADALFE